MCNTRTILREYNSQNDLYRDYLLALRNLLESLLKKGGYKYHLSHRMKSRESLKEKIKRKKSIGKIYKHLNDIGDVIGIRIVFYTESDRKRFVKNLAKAIGGVIQFKEASKVSGYRSIHAIVTFSKERLRLAEYKRFKGLKCEIQMTLILDDAWAEVEHDILYKEGTEIQALDKKQYVVLKEKLESIMHDYIQKASLGLESIVKNIRRQKVHR